jgi:hypothetical protein
VTIPGSRPNSDVEKATGTAPTSFERVEPQRVLATRSEDGNWVWTFVLDEQDGRTRLISRIRFRLPTLTAKIGMVPMEPASLVMERKMLRRIKRRAERLATEEKEETRA